MSGVRAVHRIAWVGGSPGHYIEADVTKYFHLVVGKYPDAEHVVGSDSGGEDQVFTLCQVAGKKVTKPTIYKELPGAKLLQVCNVVEEADAVVLIGTAGGQRVKLAREILKRVDGCREKRNKRHVFTIAGPPDSKKKATSKKSVSKAKRIAQETA